MAFIRKSQENGVQLSEYRTISNNLKNSAKTFEPKLNATIWAERATCGFSVRCFKDEWEFFAEDFNMPQQFTWCVFFAF